MRFFILLIIITALSGCAINSDNKVENTLYVPTNEA